MSDSIAKQVKNAGGKDLMIEDNIYKESAMKLSRTKGGLVSAAQEALSQDKLMDRDALELREKLENDGRKVNGWNNLIVLIAFLGVFRFILVNLIELGWLVEIPLSNYTLKDCTRAGVIFGLNILRSAICFYISSLKLASVIYVLVTEGILSLLIYTSIKDRNIAGVSYAISIIFDMKLISFVCNATSKSVKKFCEFLSFPTLVYKDSYNRKSRTDFMVLGKACIKLALWSFLLCFFMDQHAVPAFYRLMLLDNLNNLLESFLNFSLASIILFNIFFKMAFDYSITIFSEITRFDEKVYGEWWNARSSEEFWKNWNLPVHCFVKKHMYLPLVNLGFGKYTSSLICFIFSGAVHEYIVSMSLKSFNGWFLIAMLAQIPLHFATDFVKRRFPSMANTFFWLSFCVIGQPMTILLIYRAFYIKNEIDLHLHSPYIHNRS